MNVVHLILLILAAVCFAAAALSNRTEYTTGPTSRRYLNLVALGLLFWVLVPLIDAVNALN